MISGSKDGANITVRNSIFEDNDVNSSHYIFDYHVYIYDSEFYDSRFIANNITANNSVFWNTEFFNSNNSAWSFLKADITNSILYNVLAGIWATSNPGTIKNSIMINSELVSYTNGNNYWNDLYNLKADMAGGVGGSNSVGGVTVNNLEAMMFEDFANRDFHLQHQSPGIDIGDPSSDYSNEPGPNGDRINVGIYGNTFEAQVTNTAPVVEDISTTTNETRQALMQLEITLLGSDIDGDNLTYSVSNPSNGSLSNLSGGTVTYTPNQDWNGVDTFIYNANDGQKGSNDATVTITVNPIADAPIVNNMNFTENEDTPSTNTLTVTNADEGVLTYSLVTQPSNGQATVGANSDNTAGWVSYTPNQDWNGTDIFTYKATDSNGTESNIGTITFTINPVDDPTIANDMNTSTDEDKAKGIVLNVTEVDGDVLTYTIVDNPANGTIVLNGNIATYTPSANWNGIDTFTYKANDGTSDSNTATVTIVVNPLDGIPIANDVISSTNEDTPVQITLDGTDEDGDNLTYSIVAQPENGTATMTDSTPGTKTVVYTPNQDWNGLDIFTYKVNDGTSDSNIGQVIITVAAINNAPTTIDVNNPSLEDHSVNTVLRGSDIDNEADDLFYSIVSNPSNGSVSLIGTNNQIAVYTPTANWNGTDTFTYKVNDGELDSNTSTVTITVAAVNDAPVATDQPNDNAPVLTDEDTPQDIVLNGTDVDRELNTVNLEYSIVTDASNGSIVLNCDSSNCTSDGSMTLTYTPDANWNGNDTFTWKVNDGELDSNISTVNITVNPVNDAPTIGDPITVNVSKSTGSANINTVSFQVDITDPDVNSSADLLYYMVIGNGGFQHHAYISPTWNNVYPTTLESEVHANYGSDIEIWDQATQTFTYHAAVGHTGNETIKFYSRECGSCQLSDDAFEVTIGIN